MLDGTHGQCRATGPNWPRQLSGRRHTSHQPKGAGTLKEDTKHHDLPLESRTVAQQRTWPGWRPAVASRTCVSQQMPHPGYRRWQKGAEPLGAPSWLLICSKHRRWTMPRGYRCRSVPVQKVAPADVECPESRVQMHFQP